MTKKCMICKNSLNEADLHNIKNNYTAYSNIPIIIFIENVIGSKLVSNESDICGDCYEMIKELDYIQRRYELVREKLTNLLGANVGIAKANVLCQTDVFLENILELDVHGNYKNPLDDVPSVEDVTLECNKCYLTFTNSQQLKEHRSEHVSKQYECHLCLKKFSSKNGISLHIKNKHYGTTDESRPDKKNESIVEEPNSVITGASECIKTDVEILQCDVKPESVAKVKKSKNQDKLKPYKCAVSTCEKTFKTHGELKSHMSSHNNERPFICEVCGQGYKNKNALNIHVGMHNGINPFTCVFCEKSFTQKGALRRHMPIHTGDAPYQCDLCGKRFVHHTSFNIHRLSHSGTKQHKCNVCGLALFSGSHLKRHMRVHTGERNFVCPTCGKRFAERYNLVSHQKLHENPGTNRGARRNHRCQICGSSYERKTKLEEHLANEHQKLTDNNFPSIHQLFASEIKNEVHIWSNV